MNDRNPEQYKDKFIWAVALGGFAGGTFCTGLALSALHLNPISITTPVSDAVTFIATLMGAVVGGAISIGGTIYFNKAEQSKNNKARAYNLLQTASQMYSDMANIVGHIEREMESKRPDIESGAPIWTVVTPQASKHATRQFVSEDLALLFSIKEFSVHEKIVQLEMYRDSMCQAWDTFSDARRELRSVMNVNSIDGGLVSSTVDLKKNPEARLRILEIDSLIRSILENAPHFLEVGRDAVGSLGPAFRKSFADPTFPSVEITKIKREN